jgi:hypothetical protein
MSGYQRHPIDRATAKNMKRIFPTAVVMATLSQMAYGAPAPTLDPTTLKPVVEQYLKDHGEFCLGKFDWPIVVTDHDRSTRTSNAVQMPVMEKLGLVTSSKSSVDSGATVYKLTDKGKKSYLSRKTVSLGPLEAPAEHPGDLCVARLGLDRIVSWQPLETVNGVPQTTVKYTYKVLSKADWASDPQIKAVFPMVNRIVGGESRMELAERFTWTQSGWVAALPGS